MMQNLSTFAIGNYFFNFFLREKRSKKRKALEIINIKQKRYIVREPDSFIIYTIEMITECYNYSVCAVKFND